jgi:hypothetical protein
VVVACLELEVADPLTLRVVPPPITLPEPGSPLSKPDIRRHDHILLP